MVQAICDRDRSYPVSGGEAGDSGREMDDITPGVVDDAPLPQEATTPEAEGTDGVRAGEPQRDEHHPSAEAHSTENRPREQHQSDSGEDELEVNVGGHGVQRRKSAHLQRTIAEVGRTRG